MVSVHKIITQQYRTVFNELELNNLFNDLALAIVKNHSNLADSVLVGILEAGFPIAERLAKIIKKETGIMVPVGKIDASIYRDDLQEKGNFVTIRESKIPIDVLDKEVILIDDVLFSGRTARAAMDGILDYGRPKRISLAVLIDRGYRELPIKADFIGAVLETQKNEYIKVKLLEIDGEDTVITYLE